MGQELIDLGPPILANTGTQLFVGTMAAILDSPSYVNGFVHSVT